MAYLLQYLNQTTSVSLRLIRSAIAKTLDQSRAPPVGNCFGFDCVINEEFCDETKQGCEKCAYEHNKCTATWSCFNFCSEKAAQEICGGSTEIVETTWWLYLLIAILVASVLANIGFIIDKILKCKRHESRSRKGSEKEKADEDENIDLVSSDRGNDIPMNSSKMASVPKQPTAPP
ncbi:hypothetical protein CHS0354_042980 [Potamilus streckersoni]|uniref:Uncharacterized protein n=1 Tax=Potamilus streckersoni TaxID=2493646 RepID=A0AAE0W7K3_9BIVA|nr:hypothetical protein CHS0354_042980 [Potamilus streckersoni]